MDNKVRGPYGLPILRNCQAAVFSLLGGASLAAVYLLEDSPPLAGAAAGGCCVALALAVAWEEGLGSPKSA